MQSLLTVYGDCAKRATLGLLRNWTIIPGMLISYFLVLWIASITAPLGIAGGFIVGMAYIALLSLYYSWVQRTLNDETIKFKGLVEFDSSLFFHVISIAFIFWIALDLLIGSVAEASGNVTVKLVAQLAAFFLFNAIPELLYQRRVEGMEALVDCFHFIRDNWIEWFLPLVIILGAPLYLLPGEYIITALAGSQPLMPFFLILHTWPFNTMGSASLPVALFVSHIIPLLLCHWFMLFRGCLFDAIDRGRVRR